jgi:5-methylcytosine-specific restriction endonuclease McrA
VKPCTDCDVVKPLTEFYKNKARADGYANICKVCSNDRRCARSKAKRAEDQAVQNARRLVRYHTDEVYRNKNKAGVMARTYKLDAEGEEYAGIIRQDPCVYCGADAPSIDHVLPQNEGGTSDWWNLAPACIPCNSSKQDKGLLQFMLGRL